MRSDVKWTDDSIIASIQMGDEDGLVYLYSSHREEFVIWARKQYQVDQELSYDAFQEAILALRTNVVAGKLSHLTSSLKTYLFSIAKNQLINRLKRTKHEISSDLEAGIEKIDYSSTKKTLSDRQMRIKTLVNDLESPCKEILKMFYYLEYRMDVIAERMNYRNADVAKSQKARCIKKLKSMAL